MNKQELNSKLEELSDSTDKDRLKSLIKEIKSVNKSFEEDYDFIYEVSLYSKNVSNEVLIRKLKNFSRISKNPDVVKKQFLSSLKLYMATLGEPEDVVILGKNPMRTIKSKKENTTEQKEYSRAGITLYFPESNYIEVFSIYDTNQWTALENLEMYKSYRINMVTRSGVKYVSKDPHPEEIDLKFDKEKIKDALDENYSELDLNDLESAEGLSYLYGIALNVESTGKTTTIIPRSISDLEDDLPNSVLTITMFEDVDIEAGDVFLALGTVFQPPDGKGYRMYPNMLLILTEHEDEEPEEDESFDMNDTGVNKPKDVKKVKEEDKDEDEDEDEDGDGNENEDEDE